MWQSHICAADNRREMQSSQFEESFPTRADARRVCRLVQPNLTFFHLWTKRNRRTSGQNPKAASRNLADARRKAGLGTRRALSFTQRGEKCGGGKMKDENLLFSFASSLRVALGRLSAPSFCFWHGIRRRGGL